jgi:hypothetical protein
MATELAVRASAVLLAIGIVTAVSGSGCGGSMSGSAATADSTDGGTTTLPTGYNGKPLLHTGVCASDAGGG